MTTFSDLGIGQTAIRFASLAISRNDANAQLAILRWAFRMRVLPLLFWFARFSWAAPLLATLVWRNESLGSLISYLDQFTLRCYSGSTNRVFPISEALWHECHRGIESGCASLLGLTVVALMNQWSVFIVIVVSTIATGVGAVAFILLIPKGALFPPQGLLPAVRRVGWKFWRTPGVTYAQKLDSTSSTRFAFYLLLSTIIVQITLGLDIWLMGIYLDADQIGLFIALASALPCH